MDPELGHLTVKLLRGRPLSQKRGAVHLGPGAGISVASAPSLPDGLSGVFCPKDLVACDRPLLCWSWLSGAQMGFDDPTAASEAEVPRRDCEKLRRGTVPSSEPKLEAAILLPQRIVTTGSDHPPPQEL